mmetsp:Transcript_27517/g.49584  ORF Transcript_27517/g.49584 Transcript_27517/m.49584 type:complete len:654 (+) Transcript_27517:954-2915(+)
MSGVQPIYEHVKATETESAIYRHIVAKQGLVELIEPNMYTAYDHLKKTFSRLGARNSLGTRKQISSDKFGAYEWRTWAEVDTLTLKLASGIRTLGLARQVADEMVSIECIGICAKNQEGWVLTEIACIRQDITVVPLYETLGEEGMRTILTETQMLTVFIHSSNFASVIRYVTSFPSVRNLVFFDQPTAQQKEQAEALNITIYTFEYLIEVGSTHHVDDRPPSRESPLLICYTSGTTGAPKGAIITHKSLMASVAAANTISGFITTREVYLSFLPLSHIYEQLCIFNWMSLGYAIGFYSGNPARLIEDAVELKPTFMCSVPKLIMRIHETMKGKVEKSGFFPRLLVNLGLTVKKHNLKHGHRYSSWFWDKLVFSKFQAALGGRLKLMTTGSAPIDPAVLDFLKVALSMPIAEGYGQTESSSFISADTYNGASTGTVGTISPALEIKLVDQPELNYTHRNEEPSGEICYRGASSMKGYFMKPEMTRAAIDEQGFVHTGDIGKFTKEHNLKIIDRIKNIFKLSQGEYIAPDKLEIAYSTCPLVANIFITADSNHDYCLAFVEAHLRLVREKLGSTTDDATLANSIEAKRLIYEDLVRIAKENKFNPLEIPRNIFIDTTSFESNGLLTPTLKTKRPVAQKFYINRFESLYREPRLG